MKLFFFVGMLVVNFVSISAMKSVFEISSAPQEKISLIQGRLRDRVLALMVDKECLSLVPMNSSSGRSQILLGCIGFYFAVREESLKELNSVAEFVAKCKVFLSDRKKINQFLQEDFFKKEMALAFVLNVWNLYLPLFDEDSFIVKQLQGFGEDFDLLLDFVIIKKITRKVMEKFRAELLPDPRVQTQERALLEAVFDTRYSDAFFVIKKEVEMILENYKESWEGWASCKVSALWGYLSFY
jgi:hypothetical protein